MLVNKPKPLFFFVGKPASGKETQAKLLAERLDYPIFMSGAKFRELISSDSYLGNRIKEDYNKGALMPAWVADYLFEDFVLNLPEDKGAIFEGSGRDVEQAQTIEKIVSWLGREYLVFNLMVSDDTVIERSLSRKRDATDSSEDVIRNRLKEYNRLTEPAIAHFHTLQKCVDINGEASIDEIQEKIMKEVSKLHD